VPEGLAPYFDSWPALMGSSDNRKQSTMSDCERSGRIEGRRAWSGLTDPAVFRAPLAATLLAAAGLLASACAPPPDTAASPEHVQTVEAATPSPGRTYADAACASCHAVAPDDTRSPNPKAPSFETIANVPGMTLMAFNVALHTSHKTMPNLIVESARIEELWAYLYTLKK